MEVEVNMLGVLLAAVAAMVVGAIWYSKGIFGEAWMKLAKVSDKQMQEGGASSMLVMFILALLAAYVLAHVTYLSDSFYADTSYMSAALTSGFYMWLGFVVYATISNGIFEGRRKKLMLINLGNSLVTFLVMGWVIGLVGL